MRWPEVIYQEVNKSRLTDHFNKIPNIRLGRFSFHANYYLRSAQNTREIIMQNQGIISSNRSFLSTTIRNAHS